MKLVPPLHLFKLPNSSPAKICRHFLYLSVLLFFMFVPHLALAGFATLQKDYTYQAGETDNQFTSRALAVEQVKRLLLEEMGTYLGRETGTKNSDLTKDQIIALATGVVKIDIVDERWDGQACYIRAKITADPKEVNRSIESLLQDRRNVKEIIETRKRADGLIKEIEKLKTELPRRTGERKEQVQQEYNEKVKELSAVDWLEKGKSLAFSRNFRGAVDSYSRAIELDPKLAGSYWSRGIAYGELEDYRQAIRNFDRVVELDPENMRAYVKRGVAYGRAGNYQKAILDFDRVIELNPEDASAFHCRGTAYLGLGNFRQAISDSNRAIELNPQYARAYGSRCYAYLAIGEYHQAIRDCNRAIELSPKEAAFFLNRGAIYEKLGDYQQAIRDFDAGVDLNPKDPLAYFGRGMAFWEMGEQGQAIDDLKNAARLDYKKAQDFLRQKQIRW